MKTKTQRVLGWKVVAAFVAVAALSLTTRSARAEDQPTKYPNSVYVRLLHAVADGPKVDIYFDGKKQMNDMTYSGLTKYMRLPAGSHRVSVLKNNPSRTLFTATRQWRQDRFYTVLMYGTGSRLRFKVLDETQGAHNPRLARVFVTHLSANAGPVDVVARNSNGRWATLFRGIRYGQSRVALIRPTNATIYLRSRGRIIKTIPDVELQAGRRYSGFAFGRVWSDRESSEFQVILEPSASQ